jgi:plastocyanin
MSFPRDFAALGSGPVSTNLKQARWRERIPALRKPHVPVSRHHHTAQGEAMMKHVFHTVCVSLAVCALGLPAQAAEHVVGQKNKQFTTSKLTVKVGDTVKFLNEDPFQHNIFSLSEIATFDLGSYPKGESRGHTFTKLGVVEVECALHPNMRMTVEVKP